MRPKPPEKPLEAARWKRPLDQPAPADVHPGDAGHGERRRLGGERGGLQRLGAGHRLGVDEVERGDVPVAGEHRRIGEAAAGVLGRLARHGDGALGHRRDGLGPGVARRDAGLAAADQHAQPEVDALGALGLLERAAPDLDRQAVAGDGDRIGGVGAGGAAGLDQPLGERREVGAHRRAPAIGAATDRTEGDMAAPGSDSRAT